jgi:hypothetical protein
MPFYFGGWSVFPTDHLKLEMQNENCSSAINRHVCRRFKQRKIGISDFTCSQEWLLTET